MSDEQELRKRLAQLEQEHRDLDQAIAALESQQHINQLQVKRLKKQKLWLKDQIARIGDELHPDIIA